LKKKRKKKEGNTTTKSSNNIIYKYRLRSRVILFELKKKKFKRSKKKKNARGKEVLHRIFPEKRHGEKSVYMSVKQQNGNRFASSDPYKNDIAVS
jgi:hypothetical protein